jgi:hypothetical protein
MADDKNAGSAGAFTTPTVMPTGEEITRCTLSRRVMKHIDGRLASVGLIEVDAESENGRAVGFSKDNGKTWVWTEVTARGGQTVRLVTREL